jgi:hypothetical protein
VQERHWALLREDWRLEDPMTPLSPFRWRGKGADQTVNRTTRSQSGDRMKGIRVSSEWERAVQGWILKRGC